MHPDDEDIPQMELVEILFEAFDRRMDKEYYDGDALHGDVVRRNFKSWKDDPSCDYGDDLFDKTYLGLPN